MKTHSKKDPMSSQPAAAPIETDADLLERHAAERPDDRALGCAGEWLTFGEWAERVRTVAAELTAAGEAGKSVGLLFEREDAIPFLVAYLGSQAAGCTPVPINARLTDSERDAQLEGAGVRVLLSTGGIDRLNESEGRELLDGEGRPLAVVLYTSGTTQAPKGVMVSHAMLREAAISCTRFVYPGRRDREDLTGRHRDIDSEDTIVTTFPVYSSMSIEGVVNVALWSGAAQYYMPKFDGSTFAADLEEADGTIFVAPPAMMALWRQGDEDPRPVARAYVMAGAPMSTDLAAWTVDVLDDRSELVSWYGLTEGGGTFVALGRELADHVGAIGKTLPDEVFRIVDDSGEDSNAGELIFSLRDGETMEGYLNRPDLTEAVIGEDGWFRTGDLVEIEDDIVCLRGRRQEWINRGGYKIYPAEIEDLATTVGGVLDAVAVGVHHEVLGEDIGLCVEVASSHDHDEVEAEIRRRVAEDLADYKRPRKIVVTDCLPRNSNGKVVRAETREWFR